MSSLDENSDSHTSEKLESIGPSRDQDVSNQTDNHYNGSGTPSDPFAVEFLPNDPRNPMNFSTPRRWFITSIGTLSVFAITLTSSAYSGSAKEIKDEFDVSSEIYTLGQATAPATNRLRTHRDGTRPRRQSA